jgi:hypothetical protein
VKRNQNKNQKEFPTWIVTVVGMIVITAVIWTVPFDVYRLIARTFSPEASFKSDWIYNLFLMGTPFLGAGLLIFADALKKKNLAISIAVWAGVAYVLYWLALRLTFIAYH